MTNPMPKKLTRPISPVKAANFNHKIDPALISTFKSLVEKTGLSSRKMLEEILSAGMSAVVKDWKL